MDQCADWPTCNIFKFTTTPARSAHSAERTASVSPSNTPLFNTGGVISCCEWNFRPPATQIRMGIGRQFYFFLLFVIFKGSRQYGLTPHVRGCQYLDIRSEEVPWWRLRWLHLSPNHQNFQRVKLLNSLFHCQAMALQHCHVCHIHNWT